MKPFLMLTFVFLTAAAFAAPASRPANVQAASQPARAAETRPAYPPKELSAACDAAAETLRKRLDDKFVVAVFPPFVVAGNMPLEDLREYAKGSVVRPAETMWRAYFKARPDRVITVLLFVDDESYRAWAKKLLGDTDVSHFGYYRPGDRTLVMNISTGSGTLVHELTHSLVVYDFPGQPHWFNEGLASLHEQCSVGADDIIGGVNWRLPALQKAIEAGKLRPLREMVTADDFYEKQRDLNYAQARYLCLYMQQKGLLKDFYAYFRDHHEGEDAGVKAIEHTFGKKIEEVEKGYLEWVKTLKKP